MRDSNSAAATFRRILGGGNVIEENNELRGWETATFKTNQRIPLVVRPGNREEVQACLKIANDFNLAVYPLSTGKNWGLGSRVPVSDNNVILDLSRMNRIVEYNEDLAYVTIEPGVSCGQLYDYLRSKGSRLMVSLTGSTPEASIVGNVMERGHSKGKYADRYAHVCALEVVLPTGECIHSGFDRFPNAKAAAVARPGVGPILEGLFTQSNLGIVTRLTIWLQPFPEIVQTVFFSVKDEGRLPELVNGLRELRLQGVLNSSVSLLNDYRIQSELRQYPWDRSDGKTPLPRKLLEELKAEGTGMECWDGIWNGETAFYCMSLEHAEANRLFLEKFLAPLVDQLHFHVETKESVASMLERATDPSTGKILRNKISYEECRNLGFLGIPLAGSIPITYWRKRTPIPTDMNPDRDGCGIIWCSPTVPFCGEDIEAAAKIISETMTSFGFEPNLCLNAVTERSIDITAAILFDREVAGEDEAALNCYNTMVTRLAEKGYVPYRMTIHSMDAFVPEKDDYKAVLRTIKNALDPKRILAPGRYE